jgi:hypothetical protein
MTVDGSFALIPFFYHHPADRPLFRHAQGSFNPEPSATAVTHRAPSPLAPG